MRELNLDAKWDLAIIRPKEDPEMELGIQRLFKNKYGEIITPEGAVTHIKTAWVKEE